MLLPDLLQRNYQSTDTIFSGRAFQMQSVCMQSVFADAKRLLFSGLALQTPLRLCDRFEESLQAQWTIVVLILAIGFGILWYLNTQHENWTPWRIELCSTSFNAGCAKGCAWSQNLEFWPTLIRECEHCERSRNSSFKSMLGFHEAFEATFSWLFFWWFLCLANCSHVFCEVCQFACLMLISVLHTNFSLKSLVIFGLEWRELAYTDW